MQAIILAAGMGKRLRELTSSNTKCMVKVNGVPLIDRMLRQLDKKNLSRIVIAVGYMKEKLVSHIASLNISTPVEYVENNIYDKTNNIYSLWLCREELCAEDTLLLESDLIFEDSVIDIILEDPHENLALVDKYESWMDGTCVKITDDNRIQCFVPGKDFRYDEINSYYKTVNIYKFSSHFSRSFYVPFLEAYCKALGKNEYYEQVLRVIAMVDNSEILAKRLDGQVWYEIDDIQDLDIAESLFNTDEAERVSLMNKRYGGYWRYPKLLDFCYLVNPYFPPLRMLDEIKANFDRLITQYPSGQSVNSLLASKNFNVKKEYITVGNGAAELISALMCTLNGKVGIIRPTFEEYANRYNNETVVMTPQTDDFSYTANDIISCFDDKDISSLIVINPDNPSGNYLTSDELSQLINWSKAKGIRLIIDESFADFAVEENNSLISNDILSDNPHLCAVKSISKSYGVPGLRLGILASADISLVDEVRKNTSIWNINSLAEFFMQIQEKYQKDYLGSLKRLAAERERFSIELNKTGCLKVFPSQANFVMAEIINGITAAQLTASLLDKNILIKDLSGKIKDSKRQFIRIAIRNTEENNVFLNVFKSLCQRG